MESKGSGRKNTSLRLQAWVKTTCTIYLLCDQMKLPQENMKDYFKR